MGTYLNPGNSGFAVMLKTDYYIVLKVTVIIIAHSISYSGL